MAIDVDYITVRGALTQAELSQLEIPRFQRTYDWPKGNIQMLLDDLFSDMDWRKVLRGGEAPTHFVGAIVLQRATGQERVLVLDGQQRLVTISLIYAVLIDRLNASGTPENQKLASRISHRLHAHDEIDDGDELDLRLHLQGDDHDVYVLLASGKKVQIKKPKNKLNIVRGYETIQSAMEELIPSVVRDFESNETEVIRAIVKAVDSIGVVRLVAKTEAAAFDLFETLNDRGLALSAADLVKNKVLGIANSGGKSRLNEVADSWDLIVDNVGKEEMVNFLRHHHIAFSSSGAVRKSELYRSYVAQIKDLSPAQVKEFVNDLATSGTYYTTLLEPMRDCPSEALNTRRVLHRLNLLGARSCRPLVLYAMQRTPNELESLIKIIESVFVRAVVFLEKNPNVLEKAFAETCVQHRNNSATSVVDILKAKVKDYFGKDDDVRNALLEIQARSNISSQWRAVLLAINEELGGGEVDLYGPTLVHVEHIFPQKPSADAISESGMSGEEQTQYTGRLGNLTLLLGKKNTSLSNLPYSQKRSVYAETDVAMTRRIAETAPPYGKNSIEQRTRELADVAIKKWPAMG